MSLYCKRQARLKSKSTSLSLAPPQAGLARSYLPFRDKETQKSRGFAFLAYQDQRSTVLAVDNLSGAKIGGRIVKVDHVENYKKKIAEVQMLCCWTDHAAKA